MNLFKFFYIKFLLSNRNKSEQDRVKLFDKENAIEVKLEDKKDEKSDKETEWNDTYLWSSC